MGLEFFLLLAFSIVGNYALGLGIHRSGDPNHRKWLLALALVGNLGLLGYFKYYDFFVTSTHNLFALVGLDVPLDTRSIVLPVGISFFTFMGIAYVVDVYRRDFDPVGLGTFAVYLSFFPHLVAGPIVRPRELIPQLSTPRDPRYVDTLACLLPDRDRALHEGRDRERAGGQHRRPGLRRAEPALVARGARRDLRLRGPDLRRLLRVHEHRDRDRAPPRVRFPQNFDDPYTATSITEFWRRWHMTLSRWLRDYLYIPLGGNRGGSLATYRNLMLTMLIGGLWHGAGWTFVVWGGIHGRRSSPSAGGAGARASRAAVDTRAARLASIRHVPGRLLRLDLLPGGLDRQCLDAHPAPVHRVGEPSPLVTCGVLAAIAVGIGSQYLPRRLPLGIMAACRASRSLPRPPSSRSGSS